jgi:hypothetical protein
LVNVSNLLFYVINIWTFYFDLRVQIMLNCIGCNILSKDDMYIKIKNLIQCAYHWNLNFRNIVMNNSFQIWTKHILRDSFFLIFGPISVDLWSICSFTETIMNMHEILAMLKFVRCWCVHYRCIKNSIKKATSWWRICGYLISITTFFLKVELVSSWEDRAMMDWLRGRL